MTPDTAEWHDAARDEPQMSRRDLALAAGFDPHPDDMLPPAANLLPGDGVDDLLAALARSVELAREAARERWAS